MSYYKIGNSFVWFLGRVSNIQDPEYLGRVQIRLIHHQTGDLGKKSKTSGIEDEDLLWAWPISAVQSASLSWKKVSDTNHPLEGFDTPDWIDAVGLSPTGIAVGTYVFGFFLDGQERNIPMIFGTYHKKSVHPEPPSQSSEVRMLQLDEPDEFELFNDVAALARGKEGDGGQTLPKDPTKAKRLPITSEPESAYRTEYPYNTTYTTKSGHAIEIDDTPGHERIHIWHNSGSYEEIANGPPKEGADFEGRRVKKTVDSDFEIVMKDKNILIKRNKNEEIEEDLNVEIGKNGVINITGRANVTVKEGINLKSPGGVTITDGSLVVKESISCLSAATGSFSTPTGQVVHVQDGIITLIEPSGI